MEFGDIISIHAQRLTTEQTTLPTTLKLSTCSSQVVIVLQSPIHKAVGLHDRGLSCYSGGVSYLCGPADLEQVEPVGVPVVDDVGQFPPLLLPAPRHGGLPRVTLSVRRSSRVKLPVTLVHRRRKRRHKPQSVRSGLF